MKVNARKLVFVALSVALVGFAYFLYWPITDAIFLNKAMLSLEDEHEFESLLSEYIDQNSNEASLINSAILLKKIKIENIAIEYRPHGDEQYARINTDNDLKKSLLVSLLRFNMTWRNGNIIKKNWNFLKEPRLVLKLEKPFETVSFNEYSVLSRSMIREDYLAVEDDAFPRLYLSDSFEFQYSPEALAVISKILGGRCSEMQKEIDISNEYLPYKKYIINNMQNEPCEKLEAQYDFIVSAFSSETSIFWNKDLSYKIVLGGDRSAALALALVRLRVDANKLYVNNVKLPSGNSIHIWDGRVSNTLKVNIQCLGEFLLEIHTGSENIVYVRFADSGYNAKLKLVLPEPGGYYSPELYNMILTYFAEIARLKMDL